MSNSLGCTSSSKKKRGLFIVLDLTFPSPFPFCSLHSYLFFRRVALKQDELAETAFNSALNYAPEDAGIKKEQVALANRRSEKVKKQRAAYGKMFG